MVTDMDISYSPAPWHIGDTNPNFSPKVYSGDGRMVADCSDILKRSERETQANARLIAAAPQMLLALVMVRDADNDCIKDGLPTIPPVARNLIDGAIAAAVGGIK